MRLRSRKSTHGQHGWSSPPVTRQPVRTSAGRPRARSQAAAGDLTGKQLLALGTVGALLLARMLLPATPAAMPTPEESRAIGWYPAEEAHGLARDIFDRVNDERAARGLSMLVWSEDLARLARNWSTRMIETAYEHSPESYRTHPGYPWGMGENIAMGQVASEELHVGWMRSDGHRSNILESSYGALGVGIVCRKDGRMWATQLFAPEPDKVRAGVVGPPANDGVEPIVRQDTGLSCPRSLSYRAFILR